jgi:DNA-binding response OmpR family regulator
MSEQALTPLELRDKIRLLLVEDHVDTARALVRLLEKRSYTIETAPSVATALEAIERGKFDLILCDLGLPDGTGIDLIKKVRETRAISAIALTGFGMQEDVTRSEQAGSNAHLTKPVNLQRLEATIWKLLQNSNVAPSREGYRRPVNARTITIKTINPNPPLGQ